MTRQNIPYRVLRGADKQRLEALSMSIIIKYYHQSGTLCDVSVKKLKGILHCGHDKAVKLIQTAKESDLFLFYRRRGHNNMQCLTLKDKSVKVGKDGTRYKGEYCYVIELDGEPTLRDVVRELQNALIVKCVHDRARIVKRHKPDSIAEQVAVPYKTFEGSTGMKRTSIYNKVRAMVREGKMSKTGVTLKKVFLDAIEDLSRYEGRAVVWLDNVTALMFEACQYGVSLDVLCKVKHVMYSCGRRHTYNAPKFDNHFEAYLAWQTM